MILFCLLFVCFPVSAEPASGWIAGSGGGSERKSSRQESE